MIKDDDLEPTRHFCILDSSSDDRGGSLIFLLLLFPTESMNSYGEYLAVEMVMLLLCFLLFCTDSLWCQG